MQEVTYCDGCGCALENVNSECPYCLASLEKEPIASVFDEKMNVSNALSFLTKFFIFVISVPAIVCALGFALEFVIPGCHCTELGTHCNSCGSIGGIVQILKFGGLAYTMFALILGTPIYGVITILLVIASAFTKKEKMFSLTPHSSGTPNSAP